MKFPFTAALVAFFVPIAVLRLVIEATIVEEPFSNLADLWTGVVALVFLLAAGVAFDFFRRGRGGSESAAEPGQNLGEGTLSDSNVPSDYAGAFWDCKHERTEEVGPGRTRCIDCGALLAERGNPLDPN